jgi:hypothetical protein
LQVTNFNPERKSLVLVQQDGAPLELQLSQIEANSTPLPIAGQNVRPTRPTIQAPAQTVVQRRTVSPRKPQWLQDRLRERGLPTNTSFQDAINNMPDSSPPLPPEGLPSEIPPLPEGIGVPPPPPSGPPPTLPTNLTPPTFDGSSPSS